MRKISLGKRIGAVVLTVVCMMTSIWNGDMVSAKEAKIVEMKAGKTYTCDFDKDGKQDKIKYIWNSDNSKAVIYRNGKVLKTLQFDKETGFYDVRMQITDIDESDKTMDLWVYGYAFSDDICYSGLFEMKGNKLTRVFKNKYVQVNENFMLREGYLHSTDGKGNFGVAMDRVIGVDYLTGNHYDIIPYKLKDGKVTRVKTEYYQFAYTATMDGKNNFKAAEKLTFTKKPGQTAVAFTLKKGQVVSPVQMYMNKKGETYVQFKNKDGKKGWLSSASYDWEHQPFSNLAFYD